MKALLAKLRQQRAQAKLERIVRETRESYEREQFRRRRAAALKSTRGMDHSPSRSPVHDHHIREGLELMATNGELSYVRRTRWIGGDA